MELLTRLDFYGVGRRYVLTRATEIDPDKIDTEGSDANLFVGSVSYMAHAVTRQLADQVAALFLSSSEDEQLDRLLSDRYQESRKGASPALGTVRFSRPTSGAGAGTIAVGTKLITLTGVEYVTLEAASFGASTLDNVLADVRSVQAGQEFQVGKNQIRRFDNSSQLFDPTIQVNNDEATAGGSPRESNDVARARGRNFWLSARRGTLPAIETGAKTVSGVESAVAIEALSPSTGQPARVVVLHVADPSGVSSDALGRQVRARLEDYRAGGIAVLVSGSIPQIADVQLRLTFTTGVNTTALASEIRAAIVEFVNSLPVNGPLYRSELRAVLARFKESGLVPDEGTLVSPAGDIVPDLGRTIRTRLENVVLV